VVSLGNAFDKTAIQCELGNRLVLITNLDGSCKKPCVTLEQLAAFSFKVRAMPQTHEFVTASGSAITIHLKSQIICQLAMGKMRVTVCLLASARPTGPAALLRQAHCCQQMKWCVP
jgi:hypothetical protein